MADGALRAGTDGRVRAYLRQGYKVIDLTGRGVTVEAAYEGGGTSVEPTVTVVDEDNGVIDLDFSGAQLAEGGNLLIEFTISGSPVINPNELPLVIPVRAAFEEPAL